MSLTMPKTFTWNETVWNPRMVAGVTLWMDAADASTVTTVSGAASQWTDKSGNNRIFSQGTSSKRPTYNLAAQNGRNTLSFVKASTQQLDAASFSLFSSGNADLSIIAAYKSTLSSGYGALFGNYATGNFIIYHGDSIAYLTPWGAYNGANVDIDSGSYVQNANYLISLVRSSGSFTGWTNGATKNTVANSASVYTGSNTESVWRIGNSSVTAAGDFNLYELICVNAALSTSDRQKLEGYLAWKWGLDGDLPNDHPHKTIPPRP